MAKAVLDNLLQDVWFYILTTIAILFLIASFICPPTGIIDSSVLLGTSEIFAFSVLGTVLKAINKGVDAKVKKGDIEMMVGDLKEED